MTNPDPCNSGNWSSLYVAPVTGGPLVLFVDPPVIYNGITIGGKMTNIVFFFLLYWLLMSSDWLIVVILWFSVLVYTAGLNTTASSVVVVDSATGTSFYNLTIQVRKSQPPQTQQNDIIVQDTKFFDCILTLVFLQQQSTTAFIRLQPNFSLDSCRYITSGKLWRDSQLSLLS